MRRILLVLSVAALMAAMLAVGAGPVLAAAEQNTHNCAGALTSEQASSGFASHNQLGPDISGFAKKSGPGNPGGVGAVQKMLTGELANCGANNS